MIVLRKLVKRIPADVNPYDLVFSPDGRSAFVSNWSSDSVSVIDVESQADNIMPELNDDDHSFLHEMAAEPIRQPKAQVTTSSLPDETQVVVLEARGRTS